MAHGRQSSRASAERPATARGRRRSAKSPLGTTVGADGRRRATLDSRPTPPAEGLRGISCALNGLVLLTNSDKGARQDRVVRFRLPDLLPAFVNATRVFIVMGVFELFWIVTAWPSGTLAITWSAIFVILFSPTADQAYANAKIR